MVLKLADNPPMIWPTDKAIADFEGCWWVAHTKSRNEKALAWDLHNRAVSYFLPMTHKIRHSRGRKFKSLLPLFGGYLFFCASEEQRLEALGTNRIANLIEVPDQTKLVYELGQFEKALLGGAEFEAHQYIKAGQLCRVRSGPLMGLEGIVLTSKSGARLVLQIDMLGQSASVEIETDLVDVIE